MLLRSNDETIEDEDLLWRRILNTPIWIKESEDGKIKPSSAAFLDDYTNEVSVNVALLTNQQAVLGNYPDMGLVSIKAGVPRSFEHIISATPEVYDPSHRVICPPSDISRRRRKTLARQIANEAQWIIYPESHKK
jgi:hypothetical protein